VVAKNSTMCAGANSSSTRFHSPVGMPEPMNNRTGDFHWGQGRIAWNSKQDIPAHCHV